MKVSIAILFISVFYLTAPINLRAQHLVSGFSQGKGKFAVAVSTTRENFDEFYLGDKKSSITIRKLDKIVTQSINLYAAYGITNKIDLIMNIPYIITQSHRLADNQKVGEKNFQNGLFVIQTKLLQKADSIGAFSVTGGLGFSTPLSNYATNLIYSIGNQSTHVNPSLLVQYKLKNGLFIIGQGGYSFRSNTVPDAILSAAKIGYAGKLFYVEGWINNQTSTTGIDIGGPGFTPERFPETRVNATNIGVSVFVAGLTLGGGKRLTGRNAGIPTYYTVGLAVIF
jgi:hypothetical protein